MRESAEEKGRRYVAEGRLVVEAVDDALIVARCRGGGTVYGLGWEAGWWCSCPARGRCAHLAALQLVTVAPAEAERAALKGERVAK